MLKSHSFHLEGHSLEAIDTQLNVLLLDKDVRFCNTRIEQYRLIGKSAYEMRGTIIYWEEPRNFVDVKDRKGHN